MDGRSFRKSFIVPSMPPSPLNMGRLRPRRLNPRPCLCAAARSGESRLYRLDLAGADDTSIWFYQFNGRWLDVLDHHSSSMKDLPYYLELLEAKRREHGWPTPSHHSPRRRSPHPGGRGKSILQQLHDGAKANPLPGSFAIGRRLDVQEGIQAGRATFPLPLPRHPLRQRARQFAPTTGSGTTRRRCLWTSRRTIGRVTMPTPFAISPWPGRSPETSTPKPPLMDRLFGQQSERHGLRHLEKPSLHP